MRAMVLNVVKLRAQSAPGHAEGSCQLVSYVAQLWGIAKRVSHLPENPRPLAIAIVFRWKRGDGEVGRRGDGAMRKRGDAEMGRWGDGVTGLLWFSLSPGPPASPSASRRLPPTSG